MKFQNIVNQFQDEVKSNKKYLEVQKSTKERAKDFCSQIKNCCFETEELKKKLHSVTQENIELSRVLQDLNKPLINKSVQTLPYTNIEQISRSAATLDKPEPSKIPYTKYISTFEKLKENNLLRQSHSNGKLKIKFYTN